MGVPVSGPGRTFKISPHLPKDGYNALLNRVKRILVEGQSRIEAERVRTYWETGRIIHSHILKHDRAERGRETILSLARDLGVNKTVLYRCVKFVQTYPDFSKVAGRQLFSWSHYRNLITISDDKKRSRFEKTAAENAWSSDELAVRMNEERHDGSADVSGAPAKPTASLKYALLTSLRGIPYTYQLVERPNLGTGAASGLLVDLGFGIYHEVDPRLLSAFGKGEIVESRPKEDVYKFYKVERTAKDLFTYAAFVERVIDGDTVKVRLELGFNVWVRQVLRLRDIDCPEVGTPAGDEARDFVRSHLKEAQMIVVRSSRSDKYDRYLADIFIPQDGGPAPKTDIYLNNLLLETRRAVRAG